MSSSLPKKASTKARAASKVGVCPSCGERALKRVGGDCKLLDGTVIHKLLRLHCGQCGEDFFDPAAMKEIRRQRTQSLSKAQQ